MPKKIVLSDDDIEHIVNLYTKRLWSIKEIANYFSFSMGKARNVLVAEGVMMRGVGPSKARAMQRPVYQFVDRIRYFYEVDFLSLQEIANYYGENKWRIREILLDEGVELRTMGEGYALRVNARDRSDPPVLNIEQIQMMEKVKASLRVNPEASDNFHADNCGVLPRYVALLRRSILLLSHGL